MAPHPLSSLPHHGTSGVVSCSAQAASNITGCRLNGDWMAKELPVLSSDCLMVVSDCVVCVAVQGCTTDTAPVLTAR